MAYDPQIHHRESMRKLGYDYSSPGSYFITVCTDDRINYLATFMKDNNMEDVLVVSDIGNVIEKQWKEIPERYVNIQLGEFVIMPNHIHGIITIKGSDFTSKEELDDAERGRAQGTAPTLGDVVCSFKSLCIHNWLEYIKKYSIDGVGKFWQRNFYDHIIRDNREYENICNYIQNNPSNWFQDIENKQFCKMITEKQREEYYKRLLEFKQN